MNPHKSFLFAKLVESVDYIIYYIKEEHLITTKHFSISIVEECLVTTKHSSTFFAKKCLVAAKHFVASIAKNA
jgi:predicted MarR family transcription regulator